MIAPLVQDWRDAARTERVLLVVFAVLCVATPASHITPGRAGYVLIATMITLGWIVVLRGPGRWRVPGGLPFVLALGGLGAWAALSLLWGSQQAPWLSGAQLYLAAMTAVLPLTVAALQMGCGLSSVRWASLVAVVVVVVSTVVATITWAGLRLALPLGGASTSSVALLLCAAALWSRWRLDRRMVHLVALVFAAALTAATLSRVGIGLGVVLAVVVAVRDVAGLRRWLLVLVFVVVGVVLATSRRWGLFFDSARRETTATAVNSLNGLGDFLVGRGFGGVWEWLAFETGQLSVVRDGLWTSTEQGWVLYHAHSVYLAVLVELGAVGLLLLVTALFGVARACVSVIRGHHEHWPLAVAVLGTLAAFGVETYLFHAFVVSMVWWVMALAVLESHAAHQGGENLPREVGEEGLG